MPKTMMDESEMDRMYAGEDEAKPSDTETDSEDTETEDEGEDEAEPKTALLPKSLFMGKEYGEGDTITMKVVKDFGDEVEVECQRPAAKNSKPKEMTADEEFEAADME